MLVTTCRPIIAFPGVHAAPPDASDGSSCAFATAGDALGAASKRSAATFARSPPREPIRLHIQRRHECRFSVSPMLAVGFPFIRASVSRADVAQALARPMRQTPADRDARPRARHFHAFEHHHQLPAVTGQPPACAAREDL